MAQLTKPFNALIVDPAQGAGMLPVGKKQLVVLTGSEVKAAKSGNSGLLELALEVIDGPNKGSSGAYRLNLYHENQQTVQIAERQLSAICHATGVFMLQDSQQLHGIPFRIDVDYQKGEAPDSGNPDAKGYTEVKKVFDVNGNDLRKGQAPQAAAAPAQPPATQAPQAPAAAPAQTWAAPAQETPPVAAAAPAWGQQAPAAQAPAQAPATPAWSAPAQAPAAGAAPAWATR